VEYIGRKLKKYEEGDLTTADSLMEQANNKFKLLKVHGKWNALSQEEEKILALEACIKELSQSQKAGKNRDKELYKKGRNPKTLTEELSAWFNKDPPLRQNSTSQRFGRGRTGTGAAPKLVANAPASTNVTNHRPVKEKRSLSKNPKWQRLCLEARRPPPLAKALAASMQ
jgi:hypothetical protein